MPTKKAQVAEAYPASEIRRTQYLILYNLVNAVLWFAVLARTLLLDVLVGPHNAYGGVGEFAKWTQTLALAEIVHSAIGLVRSPIITTFMQVASRILLVWGVVDRHPSATSPSPFYSSMLVAWSITEVVRYGYFVQSLRGAGVPAALTWLRYNLFFVLYPVGIGSECVMMWKASKDAFYDLEQYAIYAVLGIYVPGSYILYTHMMTQRRRALKGKAPVRRRVPTLQADS